MQRVFGPRRPAEPARPCLRDDARVHRVVDAMNVIGSRPDGWWRDREGAIARLVERVDRLAEGGEERVTVMLEHEPRGEVGGRRVEVAWASVGGRDAADREILARLPGSPAGWPRMRWWSSPPIAT
jgi:hypothetical protein